MRAARFCGSIQHSAAADGHACGVRVVAVARAAEKVEHGLGPSAARRGGRGQRINRATLFVALPIAIGGGSVEDAAAEVAAGAINHAVRFTLPTTQEAFTPPALHRASNVTDSNAPPMGMRMRLQASFDISGFSPANQVILTALKQYGMILADNGSAIYIAGHARS